MGATELEARASWQGGKQIHRAVSAERPEVLRQAIANYRRLKKPLRGWETETEPSSPLISWLALPLR
jgi:hypothetical protein